MTLPELPVDSRMYSFLINHNLLYHGHIFADYQLDDCY